MDVSLKPGKYVVAVSGGVDSVVLLDLLSHLESIKLVVAHFDHGIRPDSAADAEFVKALAKKYRTAYETERVRLGPNASEAEAREERYAFLRRVKDTHQADAIITAHHQDDVIETAVLNVLRGTKRRGLVSLQSTAEIIRPLLPYPKNQLLGYAREHELEWREDSTNTDTRYKRNEVRTLLGGALTDEKRAEIIALLRKIEAHNHSIEAELDAFLATTPPHVLHKSQLNSSDLPVAHEIVAGWLRKNEVGFDRAAVERVVAGARTLQNGAQIDVSGGAYCLLSKTEITLKWR